MKKIYTILCVFFLCAVLVVGFVGLFSTDEEATKPKLTFAGLFNGDYSRQCRNYYGEKFPQGENLKDWNTRLNGFYKFSALNGEDDAQIMIDMNSGAANGGEALNDHPGQEIVGSENKEPVPSAPDDTTDPSASVEEPSEGTEPENIVPDDTVVENLGAALLIGNRAIEVPYSNKEVIKEYSAAVTSIATALGSGVRTFSIAVPNSAEFYTTEAYHTGKTSQIDMINYCYENLGSNVKSVDAYGKLAAHVKEYIYFRTDHHWTQLGAYYAYTAYCEAAGFRPEPLDKFETGQYDNFVGSMYTFLSDYPQAKILKEEPDTVYFYRPFVHLKTRFYEDTTMSMAYEIGTISHVSDKISNKYLCFLGGDHPITTIETDVEGGRVCLLLKESYGNAFAPWLTSHYSKVIVVDPREFNRDGKPSMDLAAFAKSQGVTDCIILNYPMMLNSQAYTNWLNRMVD